MTEAKFEVPESVIAYVEKPAVRAAVDELAFLPGNKLPASLEWNEIGSYYRAERAALQAKLDLAITLEQLWRFAWTSSEERLLAKGWTPLSPDEQMHGKYEAYITPDDCLEDWTFTRVYKGKGRRAAYLSSALDEIGFSVGIGVYARQGQRHLERADLDNRHFEYVRDYDSWWTIGSLVPLNREPDLTSIIQNAGILLDTLFVTFPAS